MSILNDVKKSWHSIEENFTYVTDTSFPDTIMLELTNACNLACTMCMNPKMERKKGYMQLELVEKIAREAQYLGIKKFALYTTGESLLHPKILEIIQILKQHGFYVYLTTNLILLDSEEKIEKLFETGIDSIKYSIDGINAQEYESIRIGGTYTQMLLNMTTMKKIRDNKQYSTKLSIGIILTVHNIDQKSAYKERYGDLVDELFFSLISNQTGHLDQQSYDKLKPSSVNIQTDWKPCRQLWDRIVVTYDGKLTTCCIDFEAQLTYANLNTTTLKEAWSNAVIKSFRSQHIEHKFTNMNLCKSCDSPYIQQTYVLEQINA